MKYLKDFIIILDKKILLNKYTIIIILFIFIILFSSIGFILDGQKNKNILMGLLDILTLESPSLKHGGNIPIIIARILAIVMIMFTIVSFFISRFYNYFLIYKIVQKKYDLIIGLGEYNRAYLNNLKGRYNIIIIESDKNNIFLKEYKSKHFGIIIGNYENILLNTINLRSIFISVGNDILSIDIASHYANTVKNLRVKIYAHISNRNLHLFFHDRILNKSNIDIIPYSFEANAVKVLWQKYPLLTNHLNKIQSKENLDFVIIGDSLLAKEILYFLINLMHLPYKNKIVIHLVNDNSEKFKNEIERDFYNLHKIKNISIVYHSMNRKKIDFFKNKLWTKDIVNIYIASNKDFINIDIALKLFDITYYNKIVNMTLRTNIFLAIFDNNIIIQDFCKKYKNLFSFGNFQDIASREIMIDKKINCITKEINSEKIKDIPLQIKEVSFFQILHIDIKLLFLNLKKEKNTILEKKDLIMHNKKIFFTALKEEKVKMKLFIENEYDRQKAYQYINNFYINESTSLKINKNNIINIPKYLALCNYKIISFKK